VNNWQPIETAPKDGSSFLVYGQPQDTGLVRFRNDSVYSAYWNRLDEAFCLEGGSWLGPFIVPTHWMPLPVQPTQEPKP